MAQTKMKKARVGNARSAARLAAVQALYQRDMTGGTVPGLLTEFHNYRLGATIGDEQYRPADAAFFDDLVAGATVRGSEIDALISANLADGWALDRLDKPMRGLLRAGVYELIARIDVPVATIIDEYMDVAHAFYDPREAKFVNGLLDAVARSVRSSATTGA
ncbi:transcription antitermination factor NusB [Polymorphobacter sp. PAMC 29334]|uniref:transcription antitermination factor NusB n=1 Tax=Polymorphobacter sp. PAMC 29334 TaxID=2862331 RepID=UPI001C74D730|nr:transcription antitermination factor NusB [Polymorphobacter sp. PAMC 29334]QYE34646.1 transcription antitermination factor NusB [Polymorphobacter sp. PAMC 29334]